MNRKDILNTVGLAVVIIVAICFFFKNFHDIRRIIDIRLSTLVFLSLLVLSTQFLNGFRLKILTDEFGLRLLPLDWFGIAVIRSFFNYLPFKSGTLANALYLNRWHDLSFIEFFSIVGASFIVTVFSSGIIGFIVSIFCYFNKSITVFIPAVFLLFILCSLFFIITRFRFRLAGSWLGEKVGKLWNGWKIIVRKKLLLVFLIALDVASIFVFSLRYYIAFRAFSINIPFWGCVLLSPLSILSTLVSITPAGLGIREGVIGMTVKILGMELDKGIYAASLDRAVVMFWIFLLGPIFSWFLMRAKKAC